MKLTRRLFSCLLALALCLSMSVSAFATEIETVDNTVAPVVYKDNMDASSGDDSGIMPLSSLSGYAYQRIYKGNHIMFIDCDGSGIGGMGITIKTDCSTVNPIKVVGHVADGCGFASEIKSTPMTTKQELKLNNLSHMGLSRYIIAFDIPDGTPEFDAYVWIYG